MHGKCEMYWRPMMYWDVLQWCFGTHNCFAVQHAYVGKKMLVYGGTKKTFALQYNMPPTAPCDGCCVKIVQFIGTHHYQVIWIFETIIDMIIIIERKGLQYHCTIPKKGLQYHCIIPKKVYSITVSYQNWFQIKRTCTDSFEVNFFMVNHACMTEVGVKKFFEYFLAFLYCGSLSILIDQICGIIIQRPIFRIPAQIFHNRM